MPTALLEHSDDDADGKGSERGEDDHTTGCASRGVVPCFWRASQVDGGITTNTTSSLGRGARGLGGGGRLGRDDSRGDAGLLGRGDALLLFRGDAGLLDGSDARLDGARARARRGRRTRARGGRTRAGAGAGALAFTLLTLAAFALLALALQPGGVALVVAVAGLVHEGACDVDVAPVLVAGLCGLDDLRELVDGPVAAVLGKERIQDAAKGPRGEHRVHGLCDGAPAVPRRLLLEDAVRLLVAAVEVVDVRLGVRGHKHDVHVLVVLGAVLEHRLVHDVRHPRVGPARESRAGALGVVCSSNVRMTAHNVHLMAGRRDDGRDGSSDDGSKNGAHGKDCEIKRGRGRGRRQRDTETLERSKEKEDNQQSGQGRMGTATGSSNGGGTRSSENQPPCDENENRGAAKPE